ncbi:MAG: hypothetical protein RL094_98 [Candidatus Parcubacteria bacterium]|jgi:hypothetical protein
MTIKWNEVTWYSRIAALIFFLLILPIWAFILGNKYQLAKSSLQQPVMVQTNDTCPECTLE